MNELKLCPFCGGEAEIYESGAYSLKTGEEREARFFATCKGCTAIISAATEQKAVNAWNRRFKEEQA